MMRMLKRRKRIKNKNKMRLNRMRKNRRRAKHKKETKKNKIAKMMSLQKRRNFKSSTKHSQRISN